jgi:hypothetical protein
LGNLQRELDASPADPHGLRLHQLERSRITVLGAHTRDGAQCVVQPLPFPGDFGFSLL